MTNSKYSDSVGILLTKTNSTVFTLVEEMVEQIWRPNQYPLKLWRKTVKYTLKECSKIILSTCLKPWSHYAYGHCAVCLKPHFPKNPGVTAWLLLYFCSNHSILQPFSNLPNNFKGVVKFFLRSDDFPNLAMTWRWPRGHPRHLASISWSLYCIPAIFGVFQSPLHPLFNSYDDLWIISGSSLDSLTVCN